MTQHYLKKLFSPSSIAVIGASNKPGSVGMKVFKNLLKADFCGKLYAVNPKHQHVQGEPCYASLSEIKAPVDLVVIATPATAVVAILADCGKHQVSAAIVLSSGFSEVGKEGKALEQAMLAAARRANVRLMGPNCLGLMRPHIRMNATFDNNFAVPGTIALLSQSGAITSGVLDWAMEREMGFSTIASLGNNADIDFGDALDYLALDPYTKSILLYIEGVNRPRHFMSALRTAARMKPVIAIKAGKNSQGARAALSHTGALIGGDDVFDAALSRAGAVRVMKIEDLFSASEVLSSHKKITGNRLAIITNGGGIGVMAADRAAELKVELPDLSEGMVATLNKVLPSQWSHHNPIDIIGDAPPERYHAALAACEKEESIDAILTMLVPVAMSEPLKVAKQMVKDVKHMEKPVLVCWMGEKQVKSSWRLFAKHQIPHFNTPEKAVEAFSYLARYHHNQQALMEVPGTEFVESQSDIAGAKDIIQAVLKSGRTVLTTNESKAVLKAFGIPVTETIPAETAEAAVNAAKKVGYPVVMKINSPDISHKSDVGGVVLNIANDQAVTEAFDNMMAQVEKNSPKAKLLGVTIESQAVSPNDREVMIGVMHDKVFGPAISFGAGGVLVEIMHDRALALPPLNRVLAESLIAETRTAKLLKAFRNMPAVNLDSLVDILLRVSEMVCELPFIQEMDLNPLKIDDKRVIAIDARIVVAPITQPFVPYSHLAIHPYPSDLVRTETLAEGVSITIRPIRPEDASMEHEFIKDLSEQSKYFRFMAHLSELSPTMLARLTQIDYDREMALVATIQVKKQEKMIGVARYCLNSDNETAEFSLVVADSWQHKGVGTALMNVLTTIAKSKNIKQLIGSVLANNQNMLELVNNLKFDIVPNDDPKIKIVTRKI
ncbi:MAG: bifunctional acetate--CoA ligase family protein/GNAT family N-acetyltransferase [Gammaproteobacteria bacterium]|nr:bifunctional acetate--CoA ligase family protein/GNAT family N-acetyltransferase [Gammaproteobacteria bacterium]